MSTRNSWVMIVVAAALALPSAASADTIRVQSTTDTVDAGLVDGLLRQAYKTAQPGDDLDYTAVGTGKALDNARNGLGDVVITHAPSLEAQFVADGYSVGLGRQIFYSDYVIVGPTDDPAGVATKHPHDGAGAFEDIAAAGTADSSKVRFNSRGENSGTNVQEQIIWGLSNVTKQKSANAGSATNRFEPGSGGSYPDWYKKTNTGQANNVNQTEACAASGNGCYTMVDRGTFNNLANAGTVTHLKILSDKNTADARGGENLLVNPFSVYIVNPDKITTDPKPNVAAATRFVDFLVSSGFQKSLESFPTAVDPAFLPDAFPAITVDQPLPKTADPGSRVTVSGSLANRLPGGGPDAGQPVQLQRSADKGKTWANAGAPVVAGTDGKFTISTRVTKTFSFRLSLPAHAATGYNQFSATTQNLGRVGVDRLAPTVSKVKLTSTGLSLHVSELAVVKAIIYSRVTRNGRVGFHKEATVRLSSNGAKTVRGSHEELAPGRYRVRITATDAAGNHRTVIRSVTRR